MHSRFSRRTFSRAAMAAPAAMHMASSVTNAQLIMAPSPSDAVIGSPRQAFDDALGPSRQESDFTVYDITPDRQFAYWVRFDANDIADSIVIDFTTMPGGGLEFSEDGLGVSRFIPGDARDYAFPGYGGILYNSLVYMKQYSSEYVAARTGGSGNVVIVDEYGPGPDGPYMGMIFLRTFIALETDDVNVVRGTNLKPGIGDALALWEAEYGEIMGAQNGWYIVSPPVPGFWAIDLNNVETRSAYKIDLQFDPPISTVEGAQLVSDMFMFPDMMSTYWVPPTSSDGVGIRIHTQSIAMAAYQFAVQFIRGSEESGTVERILLFDEWGRRGSALPMTEDNV